MKFSLLSPGFRFITVFSALSPGAFSPWCLLTDTESKGRVIWSLREDPQLAAGEKSGSGDPMSAPYPQGLRARLGTRERELVGRARCQRSPWADYGQVHSSKTCLSPFTSGGYHCGQPLLAMSIVAFHLGILMVVCNKAWIIRGFMISFNKKPGRKSSRQK